MKRAIPKFFDRIKLAHNKEYASAFRGTDAQKDLFDFTTVSICEQMSAIKKEFNNIAYVGPNPDVFLLNMPSNVKPKRLFLCDQSIKNVTNSYVALEEMKKRMNLDFEIYAMVMQEELWPIKPESLDLIVSSLSLHWNNDMQVALSRMLESLIPDGALIGTLFGGDSLQELRIAFTLAESERSGGVSEHTSPLISNVDFGNLFARCQYNLPTIFSEKVSLKFDGPFELMQYLQELGENNALIERRPEVLKGPLLGACAIYDSLFKDKDNTVPATFELIHFLGWKYHDSQQKPKKRGSAEFSLKVLQKEITDSEGTKTNYGEIAVSSGSDSDENSKTNATVQENEADEKDKHQGNSNK